MSEHVADGGNFRPWNFREMPRSRLASEMISISRWTSQRLHLSGPKASIVTRHSRHAQRISSIASIMSASRGTGDGGAIKTPVEPEASIRSRTAIVNWANDNIVRAAARYVYGKTEVNFCL